MSAFGNLRLAKIRSLRKGIFFSRSRPVVSPCLGSIAPSRPDMQPKRAMRMPLRWCLRLPLLLVLLGLSHENVLKVHADHGQASTYREVEHWTPEVLPDVAGEFGFVRDISSASEAGEMDWLFVLDGESSRLHFSRDGGLSWHFRELMDGPEWEPLRIDALPDGSLFLLSNLRKPRSRTDIRMRVSRYAPDGSELWRREASARLHAPLRDIAAEASGRLLISQVHPIQWLDEPAGPPPTAVPNPEQGEESGLIVLDAQGQPVEKIRSSLIRRPSLVAASGGRRFVFNEERRYGGGDPDPIDPLPGFAVNPDKVFQEETGLPEEPIEGVLELDAQGEVIAAQAFSSPSDMLALGADVYLGRDADVFQLGRPEPIFAGPAGLSAARRGGNTMALARMGRAGLLFGLSHCYDQIVLGMPDLQRSELVVSLGQMSAPEQGTPLLPSRIAADESVAILENRYDSDGGSLAKGQVVAFEGGNVQQLTHIWRQSVHLGEAEEQDHGASSAQWLASQGHCSGRGEARTRDLALDGDALYSIEATSLRKRAGGLGRARRSENEAGLKQAIEAGAWPEWSVTPVEIGRVDEGDAPHVARLTAIDAEAGRIAVIDAAHGEVVEFSSSGRILRRWPLIDPLVQGNPDEKAASEIVAVDLSIGNGRIFLADRGRRRIVVQDDAHAPALSAWPLHSPPLSIAAGPADTLFVLGTDRWLYRYSAQGQLIDAWSVPEAAHMENEWLADIAVDSEGRLYLSYSLLGPRVDDFDWSLRQPVNTIQSSGVRVFAAREGSLPSYIDLPAESCSVEARETKGDQRVLVGQDVEMQLEIAGHCRGQRAPLELAIVLDRSRSMGSKAGQRDSLGRAREGIAEILTTLDRETSKVSLISFGDDARIEVPLTRDFTEIIAQLGLTLPGGVSNINSGLDKAWEVLVPGSGDASTKKVLILVSDGAISEARLETMNSLRASGVSVLGLIYVNQELEGQIHRPMMDALIGRKNLHFGPRAGEIQAIIDQISDLKQDEKWLRQLAAEVQLPAAHDVVLEDLDAGAHYDPDRHTLSWQRQALKSGEPTELRFRLRPHQVGITPAYLSARADFTDHQGQDGRVRFPAPQIEVIAPMGQVFLPQIMRTYQGLSNHHRPDLDIGQPRSESDASRR